MTIKDAEIAAIWDSRAGFSSIKTARIFRRYATPDLLRLTQEPTHLCSLYPFIKQIALWELAERRAAA